MANPGDFGLVKLVGHKPPTLSAMAPIWTQNGAPHAQAGRASCAEVTTRRPS